MVASDWHDEFTLHLDENNQFYHFDYYSTSSICPAIDVSYLLILKNYATDEKAIVPRDNKAIFNYSSCS